MIKVLQQSSNFFFLTKDTCNHIFFFIIIDLILNCSFAFNCSKTGLCHEDFRGGGGAWVVLNAWSITFEKNKKKGGKQYQVKTKTVSV